MSSTATVNSPLRVYRFDAFEFDPAQFELRHGETHTTLPVALNKLLLLFVSQPGKLCTREEIADALWEEQGTVDTTAGVYTAIKRLRDLLGENRSGQRGFIETAVGAGYRFAAPVTIVDLPAAVSSVPDDPAPLSPLEEEGLREQEPSGWRSWVRPLALTTLALAAVVAGARWHAANQAVAVGKPLPRGVLQGFLPVTFDEPEDDLRAQAVSPDGKTLVWSDHRGLFVKARNDGSTHQLALPNELHVERLDWFPDMSAVLVSGCVRGGMETCSGSAKGGQLWRVSLGTEPARPLLQDGTLGTVSPDGANIAFLRAGMTELWIANADGGSPQRLAETSDYGHLNSLIWSPRSNFIVASKSQAATANLAGGKPRSADHSEEAKEAAGQDAQIVIFDAGSGAVLAQRQASPFQSAAMLPNGNLLYLTLLQGDHFRMTTLKLDTGKGAFVSAAREIPLHGSIAVGTMTLDGQLSASRDGLLSFLLSYGGMDFDVADLVWAPGQTHPALEHVVRPFHHAFKNYPTAWSPDGRVIAFDQGFDGPNSTLGQKMDGSGVISFAVARSSTDMFALGCFTPDGKWLLYTDTSAKLNTVQAIRRVPATGGRPEIVPVDGLIDAFRCSNKADGRCVLRQIEDHRAVVYSALDPIRGKGEELARVPWQPTILVDWSISPDGRTVAMANHNPAHPAIQLVDLSRGGETKAAPAHVREIPVSGFGTVLGPNWSSDALGFYVETSTDGRFDLLYVDLAGTATLLRQSTDLIWAQSSPDGKRIYFPAGVPAVRNVWLGTLQPDLLQ